jgi:hypothetical protein
VEGANLFRGGVWIAIVIVVIAIAGLFLVRHLHDSAAPVRGASAATAVFGDLRLASGQG